MKRELFFKCVFVSDDENEYHFHLRAWTAAEAESVFADMLRTGGIRSKGKLMVHDVDGQVVRRAAYPRFRAGRPRGSARLKRAARGSAPKVPAPFRRLLPS